MGMCVCERAILVLLVLTHYVLQPELMLAAMAQATPYLQSAVTDFIYESCTGNTYDFSTSDDSYIANFQAIKPFFLSQSSQSLYSKSSSTLGPSSSSYMYAIFQCRGDVSLSQCSSCVSTALSVSYLCDRWRIQLAACFVRYDYVPFYSSDDTSYNSDLWNTTCSNAVDATSLFKSNLASALSSVVDVAPNHELFGFHVSHAGTTAASGDVYVLGQCAGYLSSTLCGYCLSEASKEYNTNCGVSEGGDIYIGPCYLIVSESSDFLFDASVAVSVPSSPTTTPTPAAPAEPGTTPTLTPPSREGSDGGPPQARDGSNSTDTSDGGDDDGDGGGDLDELKKILLGILTPTSAFGLFDFVWSCILRRKELVLSLVRCLRNACKKR